MSNVSISVVLPVYNQADHVETVVTKYISALQNLTCTTEFLLVVNGNRDGTLDRCNRLAKREPSVKVLFNQHPGWGRAVMTGLNTAQGSLLCFTNLARTAPDVLVSHLAIALANPDHIVKANRRLRYPVIRRLGSALYNLECRYLFDLASWDINGTPKVFKRQYLEVLDLRESGDLIDAEFLAKCRKHKLPLLELPVVATERHGGRSTTDYLAALRMYWGAVRLWRRMRSARGIRYGYKSDSNVGE